MVRCRLEPKLTNRCRPEKKDTDKCGEDSSNSKKEGCQTGTREGETLMENKKSFQERVQKAERGI